jgi:hypothetical protein
MKGVVTVFQLTTEGADELGKAELAEDATFKLKAPGLELQSWQGARLVIQALGSGGQRAEGFVSITAFAEITRRAGPLANRLLAVLAGTETPEDVAAIMSWFHEDPSRLAAFTPSKIGTLGKEQDAKQVSERTIAVAKLDSSYALPPPATADIDSAAASWRRFMEQVFAAFRQRRGPFGGTTAGSRSDDEDDDELNGVPNSNPVARAVFKSLQVFEDLFDLMLSPDNAPRHAIAAFDLTQYVCERLQPDAAIAKIWLERLVHALSMASLPADRLESVAAAVLVLVACGNEPDAVRSARARLLRIGYKLTKGPPSEENVEGFQSVLPPLRSFEEIWAQVQNVRTYAEQTKSYLAALQTGQPSGDFSDLSKAVPEEWPTLCNAIASHNKDQRILVLDRWTTACPRHHMTLPEIEISKLRSIGVATARNCCDRVLVYTGA